MTAYPLNQRTAEIGIRVALGAQSSDVLRLILGEGLRLVRAGVVLGLIGALAATCVLASILKNWFTRSYGCLQARKFLRAVY